MIFSHPKRLPHFLFFVPVALALSLMSCGSDPSSKTETNQIFRINELGDITSLDPAAAGSFENNFALNQLYNSLVEMNEELEVKPSLAKSWDISDDGLQYTFHLRTDVVFHDDPLFPGGKGRHVKADDFAYSFDRLFDKRISNASTLIDVIDHDPSSIQKGLIALNDSTLRIRLKQPFAPFLGILSMKFFSVVPREIVTHYGDDFRTHPIGTGPFVLKNWTTDTRIVLGKNPSYFKIDAQGNRLPYLDIVSVSFIKNPESAFLQFMSSELDMLSGIDAINKEKTLDKNGELKAEMQDRFVLQTTPYLKTDYFGILIDPELEASKNSPTQKIYLRQAINAAIDREKLVRFLRYNLGTPATAGFIPPGLNAYDAKKLKGYTYNPDRARELLDLAGYPNGKGMAPLVLRTTPQYLDIADFVRSQLSEVGIPMEVEIMQATVFKSAVADGKVNFFRKSWIGDYPDPENFMSLFYSKNKSPEGSNYTHFNHPGFDRLYERCLVERNDSIRSDLFLQMDQILVNESPVIPLYYDEVVRIVSKNVVGLGIDPTNTLSLERVRKNK
jgi:oligopeptide transport system substrate-binding protein